LSKQCSMRRVSLVPISFLTAAVVDIFAPAQRGMQSICRTKLMDEVNNTMLSQITKTNLGKVLIIDDSLQMHQAFKIMLNRYTCETLTALNGQKGLDHLTSNPEVNLLIVDLNMPHMSGMEFIKRVKEQKTYDHIPIIAISSDGMGYDASEAIPYVQVNLRKPLISSELHSAIGELFPQNILKLSA
jgi:two-component system chemotaxis response regulator CheY